MPSRRRRGWCGLVASGGARDVDRRRSGRRLGAASERHHEVPGGRARRGHSGEGRNVISCAHQSYDHSISRYSQLTKVHGLNTAYEVKVSGSFAIPISTGAQPTSRSETTLTPLQQRYTYLLFTRATLC